MQIYILLLFLFLLFPNFNYGEASTPFRFSPRDNKAHLINWHTWDKDIFKRAQREDKLIFLDITAVWCHWCHVLDETTLSDPDVMRLLNKDLISLRVDADKRPDINRRYHQGGWPSVVFLTPTGEILFGATYLKPEEMKIILKSISEIYRKEKDNIYQKIELLNRKIKIALEKPPDANITIKQRALEEVLESIKTSYDPVYGGFGVSPKFHHPSAIRLAFLNYHQTKNKSMLDIITRTLDKMSEGEIFDRIEGGFFRYATGHDWSKPHFEKMLEENANLLENYLEAYKVTGKEKYQKIARMILKYVENNLQHNEGGFYASQDADDLYYAMDGNAREKETSPYVDKTIFTSINGRMASAYLMAANILKEKKYSDFAIKTIDLIIASNFKKGRGFQRYIGQSDKEPYFLSDQVWMLKALLDAYEFSGESRFLRFAKDIASDTKLNFFDDRNGHFQDRPKGALEIAALRIPIAPDLENSLASECLIRLYYFTFNREYLDDAGKILKSLWREGVTYNIFDENYALALEKFFKYPVSMVIVGSRKDPMTSALLRGALDIYEPRKIVQLLDPERDHELLKKRILPNPKVSSLFICGEKQCSLPIVKPEDIVHSMRAFLAPKNN